MVLISPSDSVRAPCEGASRSQPAHPITASHLIASGASGAYRSTRAAAVARPNVVAFELPGFAATYAPPTVPFEHGPADPCPSAEMSPRVVLGTGAALAHPAKGRSVADAGAHPTFKIRLPFSEALHFSPKIIHAGLKGASISRSLRAIAIYPGKGAEHEQGQRDPYSENRKDIWREILHDVR